MKEHGIFPKGFVDWMIDICEQSAFQFLPGDGIIPGGLRRFYDNGTEKAVYIGSFFTACCICHIMEEKYTFPDGMPKLARITRGFTSS